MVYQIVEMQQNKDDTMAITGSAVAAPEPDAQASSWSWGVSSRHTAAQRVGPIESQRKENAMVVVFPQWLPPIGTGRGRLRLGAVHTRRLCGPGRDGLPARGCQQVRVGLVISRTCGRPM